MRGTRSLWLAPGLALAALTLPTTSAQAAELDCLIQPSMVVNVSSPIDGLVERVEVDRGDLVKEGQILARLEASVQEATVALARARAQMTTGIDASQVRLDYSIRKVASNEKLLREGGISEREVDEAKAQRDLNEVALVEARETKHQAELELRRAEADLAVRIIRSPITGVVMERPLSAMEQTKQTPIVRLARLDPLYVEVITPVALLGKIRVGMQAEVLPEAPVGGVHTARVKVVDPVVDAASGTFGVRLELSNPDNRMPAGLKCRVRFPR